MNPKLLIVGSFVMDMIVTTERFCNGGETVIGTGFSTAPGGKGANQAIQAARLGADVTMVGKVGNDDFGRALINSAKQSNVNTAHILVTELESTAIGNVQIQKNKNGTENRIIVVPGANFALTVDDVTFLEHDIENYDMVILQNEIPQEVNIAVAEYAKAKGVPVMLNPAPAGEISQKLLSCLTYISPNEHEVKSIANIDISSENTIKDAVNAIHNMGIEKIIITLGKNGAIFSDKEGTIISPSFNIDPVIDPTAAGDSFIGAFCSAIAAKIPPKDALIFANCTAGIVVSRMGAQTSLPTFDEVISMLENNGFATEIYNNIRGE